MLTATLTRTARPLQVQTVRGLLPLEPIRDESSYWRAIEILDRLFLLRREKNREELEYFQALAQLAYEYECSRA